MNCGSKQFDSSVVGLMLRTEAMIFELSEEKGDGGMGM